MRRPFGLAPAPLLGAAVGAICALGFIVYRGGRAPDPIANADPSVFRVAVSATECQPNVITVPAGRVSFEIANQSARALEWEILNGVLVVDERENIAPGFRQGLTTTLPAGDYDITCGLLSNPKGRLHVTPTAEGVAPAKPSLVDLIGPMAEYKVYLIGEAAAFKEQATALANAIKSGDSDSAQSAYQVALSHYGRLKLVSALFHGSDGKVSASAAADAAGDDLSMVGTAIADSRGLAAVQPQAERIAANATDLQGRVNGLTVPPERMVGDVETALRALATSGDAAGVGEIEAAVGSAKKVADLFKPLTVKADPSLAAKIAADFAPLNGVLDRYRATLTGTPGADDRGILSAGLLGLAGDFADLTKALGIG